MRDSSPAEQSGSALAGRTVPAPEVGSEAARLNGLHVCMLLVSANPSRNTRAIKESRSLRNAGARVSLVCLAPRSSKVDEYFDYIEWIEPIAPSKARIRLLRVVGNLIRALRRFLAMTDRARSQRAGAYHAHFLNTLAAAYIAARFNRARLIYNSRDLFVETLRPVRPSWMVHAYSALEGYLVRRCDAVVVVSEPFAEHLVEMYSIPAPTVIFHGPSACLASRTTVTQPVRFFFQGRYAPNRNLRDLVRAMDQLRGVATLTLQGWGEEERHLRSLVEEIGLQDCVEFIQPCAPDEVVASANRFDVGVICYPAETLNLQFTAPQKLFDYIGAGLAVAASDLPGHRSILTASECQFLDTSNVDSLADGLRLLANDPRRVSKMKRNISVLCSQYSWSIQEAKLVNMYASFIADSAVS